MEKKLIFNDGTFVFEISKTFNDHFLNFIQSLEFLKKSRDLLCVEFYSSEKEYIQAFDLENQFNTVSITFLFEKSHNFFIQKTYRLWYSKKSGFFLKNTQKTVNYISFQIYDGIKYFDNQIFLTQLIQNEKVKKRPLTTIDFRGIIGDKIFYKKVKERFTNTFLKQTDEVDFFNIINPKDRYLFYDHNFNYWLTNNKRQFLNCIKYKYQNISSSIVKFPFNISLLFLFSSRRISTKQYDIFYSFFVKNKVFFDTEEYKKFRAKLFDFTDYSFMDKFHVVLLAYFYLHKYDKLELFMNTEYNPFDEEDHVINVICDYINVIENSHYTKKYNLKLNYKRMEKEHIELSLRKNLSNLSIMNVNTVFKKIEIPNLTLINSNEELYHHAEYMQNCVLSYQPMINSGKIAIFIFKNDSNQIFTTSISYKNRRFQINEINGRFNLHKPEQLDVDYINNHLRDKII